MTEEELKIQRFYNSKEWRSKRDEVMSRSNGLCVVCWKIGRIRNATSVHHIKKLREHFELRLDDNNLIALCRDCHELVESSCSSVEEVEALIETLKKEKEK
ncbi:MAG: HNH endonuclease [Clostridia bacterium]|nr:HNH endonuclease [Clostridia bacterium]